MFYIVSVGFGYEIHEGGADTEGMVEFVPPIEAADGADLFVVAEHPTRYSAERACEAAKVTEQLLREPWKRAIEHANHLEHYMTEGTRLAAQAIYEDPATMGAKRD